MTFHFNVSKPRYIVFSILMPGRKDDINSDSDDDMGDGEYDDEDVDDDDDDDESSEETESVRTL